MSLVVFSGPGENSYLRARLHVQADSVCLSQALCGGTGTQHQCPAFSATSSSGGAQDRLEDLAAHCVRESQCLASSAAGG